MGPISTKLTVHNQTKVVSMSPKQELPNLIIIGQLLDVIMTAMSATVRTDNTKDKIRVNISKLYSNPECTRPKQKIKLSSSSLLLRAKIAYQFTHEFMHWIINSPLGGKYLWFEEAVCEVSSRYFLQLLPSMRFNNQVLDGQMDKQAFAKYISDMSNAPETSWETDFGFLETNEGTAVVDKMNVEKESNHRPYIFHLATVLLPLFDENPERWHDVLQIAQFSDVRSLEENMMVADQNAKSDLWNQVLNIFRTGTRQPR